MQKLNIFKVVGG